MDDFWGVVVLLIIVLVAFSAYVVRQIKHWAKFHTKTHRRVLYSEAIKTIKSGDIILFVAHTHGLSNSILTNDVYSHGGIVVEVDGEPYLAESRVNYDNISHSGTILRPLLSCLDEYHGSRYLMSLSRPLDAGRAERLQKSATDFVPYPSVVHLLKALVGLDTSDARHCMQHVAYLLDSCSLIPKKYEGVGILRGAGFFGTSRGVSTLHKERLPDGYRYLNPVELLLDGGGLFTRAAEK